MFTREEYTSPRCAAILNAALALLATPSPTGQSQMAEEMRSFQQNENYAASASRADVACRDLRRTALELHLPALPEVLCEDLHTAVQLAAERSTASMSALRRAVARFTISLRDDGATPEAVLIALKSVINSRTFPVSHDQALPYSGDDLRQRISTWSIQEFFGAVDD